MSCFSILLSLDMQRRRRSVTTGVLGFVQRSIARGDEFGGASVLFTAACTHADADGDDAERCAVVLNL
jgi:hypothetical protein